MKKLLLFFVMAVFTLSLFGQAEDWPPVRKKQNFKDSTSFVKAPLFPAGISLGASYITDIFDVAARKYLTDTLLVEGANYTLVLADDGRYIRTSHATSVAVLVPDNATVAFPVGTVINFVSTLGAIDFNAAAGVTLNSELDSVNVAHKGGAATLVKRATNKWDLFGSLLN